MANDKDKKDKPKDKKEKLKKYMKDRDTPITPEQETNIDNAVTAIGVLVPIAEIHFSTLAQIHANRLG